MKEFEVTITETLQKSITVEAATKEEAQAMVEEMWDKGDVVLDADHFVGAEFSCNDGQEIEADKPIEVLLVEPGQYVVLIHDDADEFHGHDQRQNDTGYGQDHVVGKVLNHTEDSAVPALRGLTDLHRNISDLRIHRVHHPCQVGCNRSGKKLLEPFGQRVEQ